MVDGRFDRGGGQLAVLPGEKVQFIVAALSTRYHPGIVVGAASTAFAVWTAIEVWVGSAIISEYPARIVDGFTAILFGLFALLLVRSAPESGSGGTDSSQPAQANGGHVVVTGTAADILGFERLPSTSLRAFIAIFVVMAVGEIGDKTQLVTVALASQYAAHPMAIWVGEMIAIVPVTALNATVFHRFVDRVDIRRAHLIGG